jgi:capsular exopolysaccharide synthesis family protein
VTRAQLESRNEQIEALSEQLEKGDPAAEAFAIVNQSRTVQDLKVRYFEARVECADMEARYLDGHPKVAACEAKLAAVRDGLAREVRTILGGVRREYQEAVQTERKLSRLLDETKTDAFGFNQHEKQYLELRRAHDNNQRLYDLVLLIPTIERDETDAPELYVHSDPRSAAAECLRSIRTNVLFMSPGRPLRTIVVTSSGPGEGKTTAAAALAETMAHSGNRVLVIDADMRRPRLHKVFSLENHSGLFSLILGDGTPEDVVRETIIPNLFVLTCGPIPPNPAELLHTTGFGALLADVTRQFDRVIIDSPPAGVVADAVVISTQVDGTLFVLKAGHTSQDAAVRALVNVNARVLGAVLNDLDLEDRRYGQHYEYFRHEYYGSDNSESMKPAVKVG